MPDEVGDAARLATMSDRVDVIDHPEPFCFTYGVFTPRVAISAGLVAAVSIDELGAVLAHERYHVRNRDPLKLLITRALTRAFFFLPVLPALHRRYLAARELAADRRAIRERGRERLAGALVKAVAGPQWSELGAAAAIADAEHLELRVDQLELGAEPPLPALPRAAVALSVIGVAALVVMLLVTVITAGGPGALMDSDRTARWSIPAPLGALGALACVAGWATAGWFAFRWWQSARPS
ncbi:MAG: M56 family metallopeptidase [Acidimicrobiales bacterium]